MVALINMIDERAYQVGAYEKAFPDDVTMQEMLTISAKCGYDFFEISIDRTDKRIDRLYSQSFQNDLVKVLQDSPIPIGSICLSALGTYTLGNPDMDNQHKAIDIFKHSVLFAEKFGIRLLQIPACDVPKFDTRTEQTDKSFMDNLVSMIDYASIHGVSVGLENMENDYMDSVEKCMRAINRVNSPYFHLYPDAGNITSAALLSNKDIKKDMFAGMGHYVAFHLKETRPDKYGGLFYGDGHVDFVKTTNYAWLLGARRFVMEYWFTGNPEWQNDLKKANELCRNWVELSIK